MRAIPVPADPRLPVTLPATTVRASVLAHEHRHRLRPSPPPTRPSRHHHPLSRRRLRQRSNPGVAAACAHLIPDPRSASIFHCQPRLPPSSTPKSWTPSAAASAPAFTSRADDTYFHLMHRQSEPRIAQNPSGFDLDSAPPPEKILRAWDPQKEFVGHLLAWGIMLRWILESSWHPDKEEVKLLIAMVVCRICQEKGLANNLESSCPHSRSLKD